MLKSDLYESIQSSIVELACAESLSIASGEFFERSHQSCCSEVSGNFSN